MRFHLRQWLDFVQKVILHRRLEDEDFVFPKVAVNGLVHTGNAMDDEVAGRYVNEFARKVGISTEYSTHCFRRGGAQYRFMYCPIGERWSLSVIRWWGGWAEGEQVSIVLQENTVSC